MKLRKPRPYTPPDNCPVMDQSKVLEPQHMGHAGRPLRFYVPNSGFDSRDGGQS
jgi:hypothetical protein